jgi:hypothetical protein
MPLYRFSSLSLGGLLTGAVRADAFVAVFVRVVVVDLAVFVSLSLGDGDVAVVGLGGVVGLSLVLPCANAPITSISETVIVDKILKVFIVYPLCTKYRHINTRCARFWLM